MSMIETLSDEKNSFLSRREIICDFKGLGGKLKKLEAVEMVTKEFKLDGKIVIPMKLQNHTGQPKITGIFYVYDDEKLAREHVDPTIFARLDKAKSPKEEEKDADAKPAKADAEPAKADAKPAKADAKPAKADAEPAKADAEPAKADAEPAKADAEPAKADAPTDKPDTKDKSENK
jgi:ribosomal protein S24E